MPFEKGNWTRNSRGAYHVCDCQPTKSLPGFGQKNGVMQNHRLFVAALLLVMSIGLGGCFHHA